MSPVDPKIAIIGAGPAGLCLAVSLQQRSVPFTIFDLRARPTDAELAQPSGMLDLHVESGLAAIAACGLKGQFAALEVECADTQRLLDMHGNVLWEDAGGLSERPEISRHNLIKLLLTNLPTDSIRWNHKLLSVQTREVVGGKTETELDFGPGGKHVFDLVVGADGAWSRVRTALTDVKPSYTGKTYVTATIRHVTTKYPALAELVGIGNFTALGQRHGVMCQRGPQDSARIYVFLSVDEDYLVFANGLATLTASAAKERLLGDDALLGRWDARLKELVAVACDEDTADHPGELADVKALYALSPGTAWLHKKGLTIIGDAAHLMGPWAGEGVNLAMWDAMLLARAIGDAYDTAGRDEASFQEALDLLLKRFEEDMVARAKEKAEETEGNGEMIFGENGAEAFRDFFRKAYGMMPAEA